MRRPLLPDFVPPLVVDKTQAGSHMQASTEQRPLELLVHILKKILLFL